MLDHHTIKTYGVVEYYTHTKYSCKERRVSCWTYSTSRETVLRTYWISGCVCVCVWCGSNSKIHDPAVNLILVVQPASVHYTNWATQMLQLSALLVCRKLIWSCQHSTWQKAKLLVSILYIYIKIQCGQFPYA